jgi:hypothetical protein
MIGATYNIYMNDFDPDQQDYHNMASTFGQYVIRIFFLCLEDYDFDTRLYAARTRLTSTSGYPQPENMIRGL